MISIIIPTYNRATSLRRTLQSILTQQIENTDYEVIVIDNGSTDETESVCKYFSPLIKNILYHYDDEPGLLTGRHKGAELASGDILSFIDDDVELNNNWLKEVNNIFERRADIHFVTGPCLPKYEVYPPEWINGFVQPTPYGGTMCTWLSLIDLGEKEKIIDAAYVFGLNFSIRKKSLKELGGFHPDNIPSHLQKFQGDGETGLSYKGNEKGYKAFYSPNIMLYHFIPKNRMTPEYFEKRAFYQGVADSYTFLRKSDTSANFKITTVENKTKKNSTKDYLRKRIKSFLKTKNVTKQNASILPDEIIKLKEKFQKKYAEGYSFHQKEFETNEVVKKWVLKPDYWNYKLPLND